MRNEQVTSAWRASGKQLFANLTLANSTNGRERLLLILAGLFVLLGMIELSLVGLEHWSPAHWSLILVWGACFGAAHLVLSRRAPGRDPLLLPLAGLLTGWGLLTIARLADVGFLLRQSVWLVVSVGVFLLIAARPPGLRWLRRYRYTWLLGGLALLAATLVLGANPSGYGPRLWLGMRLPALGNVYVQPSEILKLLMVAYLSSYLAERRELVLDGPLLGRVRLPAWPYLAPLLVMWGLAMVLLAWQQDLGAALLFFLTFLVMLYLASGQWGYVVAGLALFLAAAAGAYLFFSTVALRVDIWLDPWADPDGRAFQVVQALIALASGGLLGQGLGQGRPTYIPAIHTDFPFTAIAEEMGLLGAVGLLAALALLTLRGLRIALNARTPFRRLLAAGLATLLGLQAWIIIAGNVKLIPLTGVTLPFVSYGGSSLLSSFIALALLTSVSRDQGPSPSAALRGISSPLAPRLPLRSGDYRRPSPLPFRYAPGTIVDHLPLRRVGAGLLAAFAGLAIVNGYWALAQHDGLRAREDNPRLVEAEQRVRRGPILDRYGVVLAHSQAGEPGGVQQRAYLTPTMPAVGYYSLKHGVGGIEASYDDLLRGLQGQSDVDRFLDELLHRQPPGLGVGLTLDSALQREVTRLMEGATGAVVLLDVHSGEILALVSQPTYDPNTLGDDWEKLEQDAAAPLLNRATQGLYQPGGALQIVVLAAALERGLVNLDALADDPAAAVLVDERALGCARPPAGPTLADAVAAACPAPIARLGQELGAPALQQAFQRWGLLDPPSLEISTEVAEPTPPITDPRLAATGQAELTLTPLHVALLAATVGAEGVRPPVHLVLKTERAAGQWQAASPPGPAVRVISAELARSLRALLRPLGDGRQVAGLGSAALSGADLPPLAWFMGLAPAQAPRYAVVVLLEHDGGLALAERIGSGALVTALARTL